MTVIKRSGGYAVRVWDRKTKTMLWVGTFETLTDARDAEARATLKPRRGRPVTVDEFAAMWLSDYARDAAATRANYRYGAKQIVEAIGAMLLADVDRPLARKMAGEWSRTTMRVARTMFGDAMRDGLIDFNPFSDLRLETPRGRKDIDALTADQIAELADMAERVHGDYGLEARAIILTLAYVGLRPGELCSVRRADVDAKAGRLLIRYSTSADRTEKAPKNGKVREVVVPQIALDAIRKLPVRVGPEARLFLSYRERPFHKGTLAYFWRPIGVAWKEKGHTPATLYHLRHACATLLIEAGLSPADVAIQLGHQDGGRLVMTLYGHPDHGKALDRVAMSWGAVSTTVERKEQDVRLAQ